MPTTTITADIIISRYAADIGFVAEEESATNLSAFIDQLYTAGQYFGDAGINGHEDLETAAILLAEAHNSDNDAERDVFLRRADEILYPLVSSMTDEYRCMVGN